MNIVKEQDENLIFVEETSFNTMLAAEYLAKDNTSIFYLTKNNKVVGIISKKDIYPKFNCSMDKMYVFKCNHKPKSSEINDFFVNNPLIHRISVWVNNELYCEYRDIDYPFLPKTIAKNILSLRYIELFKSGILKYLELNNIKKVGLIANDEIVAFFKANFTEVSFESVGLTDGNSCDIVLDFKYGKYLREMLNILSEKYCDLSKVLLPIAIKKLVSYLEQRKIEYLFVHDSVFKDMDYLSSEESNVEKNKIGIETLIKDNHYLNRFCVTKGDFVFLKDRVFNRSSTFYSGLTIKQTDISSPGFNIRDGVRYAGEFPTNYSHEIHFFGPCSVMGLCGPDDYTFEYQLQKQFNKSNPECCKVFNHGIMLGNNAMNSIVECLLTNLREGDFVSIFFMEETIVPFIPAKKIIKFKDIFTGIKKKEDIYFFDVPGHCNRKANEIIASYFVNNIKFLKFNDNKNVRTNYLNLSGIDYDKLKNLSILNPDIYSHFIRLKPIKEKLKKYKEIGSIVMYASPYTKGHEYIVKKAFEKCDALVIFAVSENFHTLNSIDRIEIIRKNLINKDRVFVVPTESYFASKQYFPEYSSKKLEGNLSETVKFQEMIYANYVCKYLGITNRYVGEENNDAVTFEFNRIVKECCDESGIKLTIIPRLIINDIVVSGTEARKAISSLDFEKMKILLPEPTIDYLESQM